MDLKQRLLIYIQRLGVSVAEFERNAGLSNGYIKISRARSELTNWKDFYVPTRSCLTSGWCAAKAIC